MRRSVRLARRAHDQRGAVLVFVALLMPVLIGVGGLAVDVGNWFSHKRHLQVQADAGALAGAGKFKFPCDDTAIKDELAKYSSVEYASGPGYNPQVGGTPAARLHRELNSHRFYDQTAASSPYDPDVRTGEPCAAMMVDVKLTETGLPWYLKLAHVVPYVNAQARVEINQKTFGKGSLPIGVPDIGPKVARALFVNEATGAVVASTALLRTGTTADGMALWSNSAAPLPVTVNVADIGVRIVLGGAASTTCGDPLVECYGAGTNAAIVAGTAGLVHVRGWATTPTATASAPQARSVALFAGTCEDGLFTATAAASPCTVNAAATVDFGTTTPPAVATTRVLALRAGANANTAVALTPPATITGTWTGGAVPVTRGEGPVGVELRWQTGCPTDRTRNCTGSGTATGTLGTVQRADAGSETPTSSGPIKLVRLSENGVPGASAFLRSATPHNLVVTVALKANLQNATAVGDPVVSLKVAGGGSQNQALDCDPAQSNLRDQLANGCAPTYKVNNGTTCLDKSALWASTQPWNCVAINTGTVVGQVTQGLNLRFLGDKNSNTCSAPNHWSSFPNLPAGDPRFVQVFLSPFGAFSGSGSGTVPVTGFATFYVTGWDGGGCQGNGDDAAGQGAIVGHFVKYIDTLNSGGGDVPCDLTSFGSCVTQFTR